MIKIFVVLPYIKESNFSDQTKHNFQFHGFFFFWMSALDQDVSTSCFGLFTFLKCNDSFLSCFTISRFPLRVQPIRKNLQLRQSAVINIFIISSFLWDIYLSDWRLNHIIIFHSCSFWRFDIWATLFDSSGNEC